ncbi:hypothetical protein AGOR_G00119860 [Albula goreensis]|uniref:Mannosyl-oligosaccharide 1,2-alpha-mannosidase IC-like n=1 Tax=Albula goreensis TaxID=1534307 RepID=A0A8T3DHC5_9TELE|nr:hypothetical protein AGOR_G00119860 [Albula goreensis]
MFLRKLPGVSASGMGLRLSQKFVFLLFLSGLVTLCFGALFFLPDSVRLKRIFLSKTDNPAVTVGSENGARDHTKKANRDPEHLRGITPGKGETSTKLKSLSRKPSLGYEARTAEKAAGGRTQEDWNQARAKDDAGRARDVTGAEKQTESAGHGEHRAAFDYEKFKKCQLKQPLGTEQGKPSDPQTQQRRDKVKESSAQKEKDSLRATRK